MVKGRARNKPDKKKVARKAQKERQALQNLWEKREPFTALLEQIVAAVIHTYARELRSGDEHSRGVGSKDLSQDESWLEVGSGLGQLRSLLPADVRDRVIHTDLSGSLVRALVERHPGARALAADVTRLPFATASQDVVLGLCAFDSFSSPDQASREIARVLRAGGRFIHFLDAATNVEPVIVDLVSDGRLPLPNFFADIALRRPELFDGVRLKHFIQPYNDLVSVPLSQFDVIVEMLRKADHPLGPMLQRYSAAFVKRPLDPLEAARTFVKLTSDPSTGRPMNQALMSLFTTLQQPLYAERMRFDLLAHSSLAHFKARLEHCFGPAFGYELRLSAVVYAREYEADVDAPLRARIRRVGIGQNSVDWPAPVGVAAHRLKPDLPNTEASTLESHSYVLKEAAVYCLVSEKIVSEKRSDTRR